MAKWGVIGVIAITFMVLFKDELKGLLSNTGELSVTTEGVKLKVRTVSTPLGETVLSAEGESIEAVAPSTATAAIGTPPPGTKVTHFVDPTYGYSIDWPAGGKWIKDDSIAAQIGAALFIRFHQSFGDFTPNVNVTIENTGPMSVQEWMQAALPLLQVMGWELVDVQIDETANAGVRVMKNPNVPGGLYQVQRVILKNDLAYVVTASKLEIDTDAFPGLYQRMGEILNSFSAP
jgi:hypothetical protein